MEKLQRVHASTCCCKLAKIITVAKIGHNAFWAVRILISQTKTESLTPYDHTLPRSVVCLDGKGTLLTS